MEAPEEITVDLMQQVLREGEKDSSIAVLPSLEVEELKEIHGGSCMRRVVVQYTKEGSSSQHTASVIVKVLPSIPSFKELNEKGSMFPREIQMFQEILPRIWTILAQALPGDHADFAARVYYARKTPRYLIAIEDLVPKGFRAPERRNGLDLKHCRLAIRTLARFHAASVVVHLENPGLFEVFDVYAFQEEAMNRAMRHVAGKLFSILSKAVDSWPELGPSWGDRLRRRGETLYDDLGAVWTRDDGAFNVLNHGDFGLHNLMFRDCESSGEPEAVMLVDFQCCSYNSPVLDLHQFLYSSATDEVRADHTDALLREYHAELTATLEALGAPKNHTISYPQLLQEFENKMLYALLCSVCYQAFGSALDSGVTMEDIFHLNCEDINRIQKLLPDTCVNSLKRMIPIFGEKMLL